MRVRVRVTDIGWGPLVLLATASLVGSFVGSLLGVMAAHGWVCP